MNDTSEFLFARPSFWSGVARTLDLGGVFDDYNYSASAAEAEARAMRADWTAVGNDLRRAMLAERGEDSDPT